ncbi:MAG: hypothetical protein IPJ41_10560 [Phycisphaerales bacterium]|nr:hypothetical protein [Phycisphaerales bacterium]
MSKRTHWIAVIAALVAAAPVLAQGGAAQPAPTPAAASAPPAPVFELLESGSGAKHELRYAPKAGAAFDATMSMEMSMATSMGGQTMPSMQMPKMNISLHYVTGDITDGDIHYTAVITDAQAEGGPVAAQVNATFQQMKGLKATALMSDRGVTKSFEFEKPANVTPQIAQQMDSMKSTFQYANAMLPEEAVGPGAKWRVTSELSQGGIKMKQECEYTLVSFEDGVAKVDMKVKQSADPQELKNDQMPAGVKVELKSLEGSGEGTMSLNTAWLAPVSGDLGSTVIVKMAAPQMGEIEQHVTSKIGMSGKKAD